MDQRLVVRGVRGDVETAPGHVEAAGEAAKTDGVAAARRLEVDGGVGPGNIAEIAAAGADTFVAGSAVFNQPSYEAAIKAMRLELEGA